jgi:hypothetical protein
MASREVLGKRVPDLVLVMDLTEGTTTPEFRVQCEVVIDDSDAKELYDLLYVKKDVTKAHKKIKTKLTSDHKKDFRDMIDSAFRGNGSKD